MAYVDNVSWLVASRSFTPSIIIFREQNYAIETIDDSCRFYLLMRKFLSSKKAKRKSNKYKNGVVIVVFVHHSSYHINYRITKFFSLNPKITFLGKFTELDDKRRYT